MSLAAHRPRFSEQEARRLAADLYGLDAVVHPLPGERDQNFVLRAADGTAYVLKIASAGEARALLDLQHDVLAHLAQVGRSGAYPRVCPTSAGEAVVAVEGASGARHNVRLLTYLEGVPLARVRPHGPALLRSLGRLLGETDAALAGFEHPAARRSFVWDLQQAPTVVREHLRFVADPARRALVRRFLDAFARDTVPRLAGLRTSLVHNDANDYNVLVDAVVVDAPSAPERHVVGLIDFGDLVHTYTVAEPAVAAAYAMLDAPDPLAAMAHVAAGYHDGYGLEEAELDVLFPLSCMRLCTSVVLSAKQGADEPENAYLTVSERPAWALLERLAAVHPRRAVYRLRHACGLPPCPQAERVAAWLAAQAPAAGRIVDADLRAEAVLVFDLSVGSTELAGFAFTDLAGAAGHLAERMRAAGVRVGVGRYDEARAFYTAPQFRGAPSSDYDPTQEGRTVHLGIDLFMDAGAPVFAPLDGTVHSFADNAAPLDYGPTILLEHCTGDGTPFYTVYGHLSRASLEGLQPGAAVARGDRIGALGGTHENGGWSPHLHFQVVTDLMGWMGDYPGVAAPSERAVWTAVCPDPNLILGIPPERFLPPSPPPAGLLERRRRHVGPSLSLSYRTPLHIVRGAGAYLYDAEGRAYLDCVNNVAHVGHAHPHVVRALQAQAAVLNTNTRYLHEHLVRYAERLAATLPDPLRVCFFVNSGSEANDLALRLARTHTGRRDVVVLEGAYHGNLTSLVDVSPYKFDGPGGAGRPPHTRVVPMPDPYRGRYRDTPDAGARYAAHVRDAVEAAEVAAFVAEPILSCGGQVVPPPGFFAEAYRHVRAAGGVCIADEVQVGFGRVGTHFWGFETHDVVPDVVTMGKPIGNGHPLGAVVTTPEIAVSFANGMEYFNTFGGNPVSCAVGLAVLDVMEAEGLQAHARRVGDVLKAGLARLMDAHPVVGDVRGRGLFLGVELVRDRAARTPAAAQAAYLVERMKAHGILLSTDGPDHNVVKIKPPLAFSEADAGLLLRRMEEVLAEDFLQIAT